MGSEYGEQESLDRWVIPCYSHLFLHAPHFLGINKWLKHDGKAFFMVPLTLFFMKQSHEAEIMAVTGHFCRLYHPSALGKSQLKNGLRSIPLWSCAAAVSRPSGTMSAFFFKA